MVSRISRIHLPASLLVLALVSMSVHFFVINKSHNYTKKSHVELPGSPWGELQRKVESRGVLQRDARWAFRFMRGPSEPVPPHIRTRVRATLGMSSGELRMTRAQYARTSGGGIWVARGNGVLCLIQAGKGAVTCDSSSAAADHGLSLALFSAPRHPSELPRHFLVLGIVPDWVALVVLRIGKSTPRAIIARENTYALRAGAPIFLEALCTRSGKTCWRPSPR